MIGKIRFKMNMEVEKPPLGVLQLVRHFNLKGQVVPNLPLIP